MTTPAALGERVLRRLGVAVVTVADRPPLAATVSVAAIAERALRGLGVPVAAAVRPPLSAVVSVTDLAERALQALGVTVAEADRPVLTVTMTTATIATAALMELGVIAADETPSSDDLNLAIVRVSEAHDALVAQGAAAWASTAVPQAVAEEYTRLTAISLAPAFGKQGDASQQQVTAAIIPALEARIKRTALIAQSQDIAEARLAAIHDELVGAGFASWTAAAIPQAVSDDYIALATQQLAPLFGAQAPAADATPLIEARVKRYTVVLQAQMLTEARVQALHDEMVGNGSVSWAATAIPQAVSDDYVALAMIAMAPVFDMKADPAGIPALEARVRKFSMVQRAPDLATEAVMAVHEDLAARGKTRWTSWDIPAAAERPYVLLAAFHLAPEFAVQPAPNDVVLAERALARLIALPTSGTRMVGEYF